MNASSAFGNTHSQKPDENLSNKAKSLSTLLLSNLNNTTTPEMNKWIGRNLNQLTEAISTTKATLINDSEKEGIKLFYQIKRFKVFIHINNRI